MRTGIVFGSWDLLNIGHINLFKEAKKKCDYLIVGLQVDPHIERTIKNKPIESIFERQIKLYGCKYVDSVIVYELETDIPLILKYFKPNVRFLGSDYEVEDKPITDELAVPIEYIDSLPIHTSDIRKRLK
jgi:glycerol-3-phosphate cytidylyltransferase